MAKKEDDLSPSHLNWLVESRARNQRASAKLFGLLEAHGDVLKQRGFSQIAQALVAVSFSLWRAAFLADKSGKRVRVFDDAKYFLAKMLIDNAINYSQDRAAREWTFNYYMVNAEERLGFLSSSWPQIDAITHKAPDETASKPKPKMRWDRCQRALEYAVNQLENGLGNLPR